MWRCGDRRDIALIGLLMSAGVAALLSISGGSITSPHRATDLDPAAKVLRVAPTDPASFASGADVPEPLDSNHTRLARARRLFSGPELDDEFVRLADGVPSNEISTTLLALSPQELNSVLAIRLVERWAERDPGNATRWAAELSENIAGRQRLLERAAEVWLEADLVGALSWFEGIASGSTADLLRPAMAAHAAGPFPVQALRLALLLPDEHSQRVSLIHSAIAEWARVDLPSAFVWIEKTPDPATRDHMIAALAASWAARDPAAALRFVLTTVAEGEMQEQAATAIVRSAPSGNWLHAVPDAALSLAGMGTLATLWASADPRAAAEWLARSEPGPMRDEGIAAYARTIARSKPELAFRWTTLIADPRVRAEALEKMNGNW